MCKPVTIEFVGPPAAGKTTLSRAVADGLAMAGQTVNEPARRVASLPRLRRIATKATLAMGYSVHNPRQSLAAARAIVTSTQRHRSDIPRLLLNWLFVQALHRPQNDDITLLDQGVLQACWSIGYRSRRGWEEIFASLPLHRTPDVVVFVRANGDTLTDRLQQERASRTRVTATAEEVRRSIDGIDRLEVFLEENLNSPETITVENGAETSIDTLATTVVEELERFTEIGCYCGRSEDGASRRW